MGVFECAGDGGRKTGHGPKVQGRLRLVITLIRSPATDHSWDLTRETGGGRGVFLVARRSAGGAGGLSG